MFIEEIYKWSSVVGVQVAVDMFSKSQRVNPSEEMDDVNMQHPAKHITPNLHFKIGHSGCGIITFIKKTGREVE